ncbi:type IV pilin protein [Limnohabitans sp. yimb22184]|uniref:type IV pilin protein n=1 Tax=Limnohabitans sp. YIMB22184 TaxID=3374104 RepID=UPI003A86E35F
MPTAHRNNHPPKRHGRHSSQGWTLAELLITMALMGLLAALALPTYQQQQRQVRRGDGQAALLQLQVDQARWRSTHDGYADTLAALGWPSDRSPQGHYQVILTEANAEGYAAQAIGLNSQAADWNCTPLRLNWQGSATAILGAGEHPDSDPNRCWRR